MPTALVYNEDHGCNNKLNDIFISFPDWDVHIEVASVVKSINIHLYLNQHETNFLIYARKLGTDSFNLLLQIRLNHPFLFIIYYYQSLLTQEFFKLNEIGINSFIIGIDRDKYLQKSLPKFWKNHWKRIPDYIYPANKFDFSPRAKKIISYIENTALINCNVHSLAHYLKISESHFRRIFKQQFRINFREFKQRLLNHYETILLFKQNLSPTIIYKTLSYKNIANFSRSFKARHGDSYRHSFNNHIVRKLTMVTL